jgi:hypothetical protein
MQSGHVFLYRNMPITSTSLTPRKKKKNLNDQQYEIKVQRQKIEQILYAEVDVGLVSRGMKAKKIHLHKLMHFLCI